LQTDVPLVQLG